MRTYKAKVSQFFSGPTSLGDLLQRLTPLNQDDLQDAATKGAIWYQRQGKGKILRVRTLSAALKPEDQIVFYYDPKILKLPEFNNPVRLEDNKHYSIWIKPAGIMSQGTQTGDHTSLLRAVEKMKGKEVYLIHRLDRETEGIMVVGHNPEAAAVLGDLFQKNKVTKVYEAVVLGEMESGFQTTISASLDDKKAITHLEVVQSHANRSLVRVEIETGRLHQIRRHLDFIGHPIMGDPKYGKGNKNKEGLKLLAYSLSFVDPWDKKTKVWTMNNHLKITT